MHLKHLQGLLDQVSEHHSLSLPVFDFISQVHVLSLVEVEDGQNLSVVGHKSFSNGIRASNESLQDFKGDSDDFRVSGVEGSLDGNNELGNDRQNFGASLFKHVENSLHSQESVRIGLFSDALEEDGQVVVVVELLDVDLPGDSVLGAVFNRNRQVSSLVEPSEVRNGNVSSSESASFRFLRNRLGFGHIERSGLSSESTSFFKDSVASGSDALLMSLDRFNFRYFGDSLGH